jgi:preprotein translocase subunit SecG
MEVKKLKILLLILQVITALGLITAVLLQSGRSAGLSGSITGGGEALFGKKKGLDEFLSKLTAYLSAAFIVLTMALALMK